MTVPLLQRRLSVRGFTLIELMITVAIVGILAAIAYPSYKNFVLKGRRAQGRTAIMEVMQQQERYMTQNNKYAAFDKSTSPQIFKTFSGDNPTTAAYDLSANACPITAGGAALSVAECIQVVATPRDSYPDPAVGAIRLTSTGVRDCSVAAAANSPLCWP